MRASRWQRMLDKGVYSSVSEIGDPETISKSYVSRILRLAPLAAEIIEAILAAGRIAVGERDGACVCIGVMEPRRGLQVNVAGPSAGDGSV
jgi:hypothetical protein